MKQNLCSSGQLPLDGFLPLPEALRSWNSLTGSYESPSDDNFLLAIYPPAEVAAQIHELLEEHRSRLGFLGRARPQHILHATLCLLKDESCLKTAEAVGNIVRASPFDVTFDRSFTFDKQDGSAIKQPYVLSCDQRSKLPLRLMQRQLHAPLLKMDLLRRKGFAPHVTLLYDSTVAQTQMITPVCWHVDSLALVHSHSGKTHHEVIRNGI